jgi:hypothetical protein
MHPSLLLVEHFEERNRRVFDSLQKNELQVALSTKEEIKLYSRAFNEPEH